MKKLFIVVLLAFVFSLPVQADTAFVQSKNNIAFGATSVSATFDSSVTAGNLIVAVVSINNTSETINSTTDTQSNSYTPLDNPTDDSGNGQRAAAFYAENVTGGSVTVTANFSASVVGIIAIHEISGADITSPEDGHAAQAQTNPGTGTDAVTSGDITPSADGAYIFGATFVSGGSTTPTIGTNFALREQNAFRVTTEDLIQGSAGAIAATFTTTGAIDDFITFIVAFKPPAAGGVALTGPIVITGPVIVQ